MYASVSRVGRPLSSSSVGRRLSEEGRAVPRPLARSLLLLLLLGPPGRLALRAHRRARPMTPQLVPRPRTTLLQRPPSLTLSLLPGKAPSTRRVSQAVGCTALPFWALACHRPERPAERSLQGARRSKQLSLVRSLGPGGERAGVAWRRGRETAD